MDPIVIVLAVLALGTFAKAGGTAKKLQYQPDGLIFDRKSKKLFFDLTITNPTKSSLKIDTIALNFFVAGRRLGGVEKFSPITITGRARTKLRLTVRPDLLGSVAALTDLLLGTVQKEVVVTGIISALGIDNKIRKTIPIVL